MMQRIVGNTAVEFWALNVSTDEEKKIVRVDFDCRVTDKELREAILARSALKKLDQNDYKLLVRGLDIAPEAMLSAQALHAKGFNIEFKVLNLKRGSAQQPINRSDAGRMSRLS